MGKAELKISKFNVKIGVEGRDFIYNTITDNFLLDKGFDWEQIDEMDQDIQAQLIRCGFIVDAGIDEKQLISYSYNAARYNSRILNIFLIPSMVCNFSCDYCFANHANQDRMDKKTANSVLAFLLSLSRNAEQINITWGGGGEPLTAVDTIIYLESRLRNRTSVPVYSTVITNGSLLDEATIGKLKKAGLQKIVVTLDGPAEIHNRRRKTKDGGETFDCIKDNLALTVGALDIVVRMVIDQDNYHSIDDLIDSLRDIGSNNLQFTLSPRMYCNSSCTTKILESKTFAKMLSSSDKYKNCYWGGLKPYLSICNAQRNFDFAIDPRGNMYKCPVEMGDESYKIGSTEEGITTNQTFLDWMSYCPEVKEKCYACKYLPVCISLCAKVRDQYVEQFGCKQLSLLCESVIKNRVKKWL
ncbi:MAG: radical SAM protein [Clostridia bacterium]|nr:radical SAM protein [Clostridia bacterium]